MIEKPFEHLTMADFVALVDGQVAEGRSLEFKRELPTGSDADVKEFLGDATSLANSSGGDLIFGIAEEDGIAHELIGVAADSIDATLLRLENLLRDGVEPRLIGAKLKSAALPNGRSVILLRLPASLAAPHRVRFKNSGRFYARNSRGKYEMDVHELRVAFGASEGLPSRLRALHSAAVEAAKGHDFPFRLESDPAVVVSVIPLAFFRELRDLPVSPEYAVVPTRLGGGYSYLHSLEGVIIHTPVGTENTVRSYALTHRSGRVDAAWTIGGLRENLGQQAKVVFPGYFRSGVLEMTRATKSRLHPFGIEGPWVVFASLLRIGGFRVAAGYHELSEPAWRGDVSFPEIVADDLTEETLGPLFRAFPLLFGIPSDEYRWPA